MEVCRGGDNQGLHRDQWRYLPYMRRDPAGAELTMAVMVAGTDFTTENGATRFVPESNRWPDDRKPEEHEIVLAVMSQGSAAFWLGSVLHGYGRSSVDSPRTGFIYSFGLDYLAQEENQFLAVPPKIARTLPVKARQLLGYRSSPMINWVEGTRQGRHAHRGTKQSVWLIAFQFIPSAQIRGRGRPKPPKAAGPGKEIPMSKILETYTKKHAEKRRGRRTCTQEHLRWQLPGRSGLGSPHVDDQERLWTKSRRPRRSRVHRPYQQLHVPRSRPRLSSGRRGGHRADLAGHRVDGQQSMAVRARRKP